jgi:tetratricopeptide (TPR) repeat protein
MAEEVQKTESGGKKAWPLFMGWVGNTTALIGLFASLAGGVAWFVNHQRQKTEHQAKMALAQSQAKQGEYQAAVETYGELLKADPLDRAALDQQLTATMQWAEDFHVPYREGQNAADIAAPELDQIMQILDAGLTRTNGARTTGAQAADVEAHIGWTHWLNQHFTERDYGPATEQAFHTALNSDPTNVYANAMLGDWMLQHGGNVNEGIQHLETAVASGKARPFVRSLQLSGLLDLDKTGARAELVKVANQMRKSGEPLDEEYKRRVLNFCFNAIATDHNELVESLTAVPADEAWNTYLWLDDNPDEAAAQLLVHDFIHANLLEIAGKRQESLATYSLLKQKLKDRPGSLKNAVDAAMVRLSQK